MPTQNSTAETTLGQRLRHLRGEATQEDFARLLGISRAALANYETERTRPKPSQLREFSRRIGISDDFLLNGSIRNELELNLVMGGPLHIDVPRYDTPDEQSFVRMIRLCRPDAIARIASVLLQEVEENPGARASADPLHASDDLTRIAAIARDGTVFQRGKSEAEGEGEAAWKAFVRLARGKGRT